MVLVAIQLGVAQRTLEGWQDRWCESIPADAAVALGLRALHAADGSPAAPRDLLERFGGAAHEALLHAQAPATLTGAC